MDVITFIEKDASRAKEKSRLARGLRAGVAFAIPVGLGILLRDDYDGVFEARTFIPNVLAACLIFLMVWIALRAGRASWRLLFAGALLGAFLATDRVFFPLGARTAYPSLDAFWHENGRCFTKGGGATVVAGLWLSFCAFATSSWPSRRGRAALAALAGTSGVIMLGFHCDSSSVGHVLVAHVGQGLVLGALVFILQETVFYFGLKRSFPELTAKLRGLHRIG